MIKQLFDKDQDINGFRQAIAEITGKWTPAFNFALEMAEQSSSQYNGVRESLQKLLRTRSGLEATKDLYMEMQESLPDILQVYLLGIFNDEAKSGNGNNAQDFLEYCLINSDEDVQEEFMTSYVFSFDKIEKGEFDPQRAALLLDYCDDVVREIISYKMADQVFESLAYYAYGVEVSIKSPTMAVVKSPGRAEIPFDKIDDPEIRSYCQENERLIHDKIRELSREYTQEEIKRLKAVYESFNIPFDPQKARKEDADIEKEMIAGLSREDHWQRFLRYGQALKVAKYPEASAIIDVSAESVIDPDKNTP